MKQFKASLMVAACALALAACDVGDNMAKARAALESGDGSAATLYLKTAIQQDGNNADARRMLAQVLLSGGDPRAALVELEKVRELRPQDESVLPLLGEALLAAGRERDLLSRFATLQLSNPAIGSKMAVLRALAELATGSVTGATSSVQTALQLDATNVQAMLMNARVLAARGQLEQAIGATDKLLAQQPDMVEALVLKGSVMSSGQGDHAGASQHFRKAVDLRPRHLPAQLGLLDALLRAGDTAQFKAAIVAVKKLFPGNEEVRFFEVYQVLLEGDIKAANEGALALLRIAPDSSAVLQLSGLVDAKRGALQSAVTKLSKAVAQNSGMGAARIALAETHLRLGEGAKALAVLQPLLGESKVTAAVFSLAAQASLQGGDAAKAIAFYKQAIAQEPKNVGLKTMLALLQAGQSSGPAPATELEALAAADTGTSADIALISDRMLRQDYESALRAIDKLQAKVPGTALASHLRGRAYMGKRDVVAARAAFEAALKLDANYLPSITSLVALDVAVGSFEAAAKSLDAFLARNPTSATALMALADVKRRAGEPAETVGNLLVKAVASEPESVPARQAWIGHLLDRRQVKSALVAAQEALGAIPERPELLDMLGRAEMAGGNPQQAIAAFNRMAKAQRNSPEPHLRMAEAQLASGNSQAAEQSLNRALEVSPRALPAQQRLIQIAVSGRRFADALRIAKKVQAQRPSEATGFQMEAGVHTAQANWPAAINSLQSGLKVQPSTGVAKQVHGAMLLAGRSADANAFASNWERVHPRDVAFMTHVASVALGRRDFPAAETKFRQIIATQPDDAQGLNNLAWLLVQQQKPGALPLAERANQLLPGRHWIMDTLAAAYMVDKQYDKALDWQLQAVTKAPAIAGYRLALAKIYIQLGKNGNARTELQKLTVSGDKSGAATEAATLLRSLPV